jgi:hypothetical protein
MNTAIFTIQTSHWRVKFSGQHEKAAHLEGWPSFVASLFQLRKFLHQEVPPCVRNANSTLPLGCLRILPAPGLSLFHPCPPLWSRVWVQRQITRSEFASLHEAVPLWVGYLSFPSLGLIIKWR